MWGVPQTIQYMCWRSVQAVGLLAPGEGWIPTVLPFLTDVFLFFRTKFVAAVRWGRRSDGLRM